MDSTSNNKSPSFLDLEPQILPPTPPLSSDPMLEEEESRSPPEPMFEEDGPASPRVGHTNYFVHRLKPRRLTFQDKHAIIQPPKMGQNVPESKSTDEFDGGLSSFFFDSIKAGVLHLLNSVIVKYRKDSCNGCLTDHPSQKQHMCLEELDDSFHPHSIHTQFFTLKKRLCTPRFIPAIQRLLIMRNIMVDDARVRTAAEALLHELRSKEGVMTTIDDMYENMIAEDGLKLRQLRKMKDYWDGIELF